MQLSGSRLTRRLLRRVYAHWHSQCRGAAVKSPALFQIGDNAFGFSGHPGFKLAMAEDLIMEFEESPADTGAALQQLRGMKRDIEDALVPIMTGLVQLTGLMQVENQG